MVGLPFRMRVSFNCSLKLSLVVTPNCLRGCRVRAALARRWSSLQRSQNLKENFLTQRDGVMTDIGYTRVLDWRRFGAFPAGGWSGRAVPGVS